MYNANKEFVGSVSMESLCQSGRSTCDVISVGLGVIAFWHYILKVFILSEVNYLSLVGFFVIKERTI